MTKDLLRAKQLAACERVIKRGMRSFIAVGTTLLKIRKERLYHPEYRTFDEYCRKRWGWSRIHAHRQIQAADIGAKLLPRGNALDGEKADIPETEKQIRPLAQLPPEQRQAAWDAAVKYAPNGKPTARQVAAVVREMKPQPTPAEAEANRRAQEAEQKLRERLADERADHVRRHVLFRRFVDAVQYIADFHIETAATAWDGITLASGGYPFTEHLRKAIAVLTRLDREHPNEPKRPAVVIERPAQREGSA